MAVSCHLLCCRPYLLQRDHRVLLGLVCVAVLLRMRMRLRGRSNILCLFWTGFGTQHFLMALLISLGSLPHQFTVLRVAVNSTSHYWTGIRRKLVDILQSHRTACAYMPLHGVRHLCHLIRVILRSSITGTVNRSGCTRFGLVYLDKARELVWLLRHLNVAHALLIV